ncbi:hypothetical protein PHYPSEUDO_012004 [Phytophthora pseudosyringae]|uniref:Chitin-binding type-4 domain-containing protein n=1 Tax=Phytophthora pseudosyringae TaxID=221518 RepID=A0A8T1W553_9STRA|nr:hypothetical protein PHYPSEUDO_012004 [Phytophthora pseudosyringae]
MKLHPFSSVAAAAALLLLTKPTAISAHGQMTTPTPRSISQQYRADCGALSGAGDQELEYAPVELLNSRAQSDRPSAATFNILNGCRGTVYEANNTVTELAAGTPFDVEWVIQAPHPGSMVLSIVKPSTDSSGTISYESVVELLTINPFAENSSDNTSTTATIPTSVTGCGSAGDCALQFYWHSDLANQTYPTCADIVVTGRGEPSGQSLTATAPSATTATPNVPTPSPNTSTTTKAPVATTATPATASPASDTKTEAPPESASTSEKCTRRQRRLLD